VKFNSAAQLGVATSYTLGVAAGSTGLTWTNLTQVIEYAGAVDVDNSKTIYIDHDALNGGTFVYRNSGAATLNHTGDIYHNRATISETLSLDASGGPIIIWGQLREASTGILSVTKTGTYAATLRGINTFRGNLTLSAGMTYGVSLSALGANNAATVQVSGGAALSMDVACNYNAGKVLAISGVGPVMGTGNTGSLILNWTGTHTYSGGVSATGATYVRATATSTLNATVTSNNSNLRLGAAAGNTVTFSGAVSGTNGLLIGRSTTYPSATVEGSDTGTVVLGAANTFTAPSKINFGTLSVDADNKLGTAPASPTTEYLVIGQGTVFKATGTFTLAANRGIAVGPSGYDLGTGASSIEVASGQTLTYAGVIANNANGAGTLAKIGTGKLVLSNANTYSGGTDITTGTLRATHLNALGTGPVVQSAETVLQTPNSNGKIVFGGAYSNNGGILRIGGST
jgi:autotransporter-associated beta strand protein